MYQYEFFSQSVAFWLISLLLLNILQCKKHGSLHVFSSLNIFFMMRTCYFPFWENHRIPEFVELEKCTQVHEFLFTFSYSFLSLFKLSTIFSENIAI